MTLYVPAVAKLCVTMAPEPPKPHAHPVIVAPGDVDPLPLNVTTWLTSGVMSLTVNAATGSGREGNVTAGTARHSASAVAWRTMFEPTSDPMIGVTTRNGDVTSTLTVGGPPAGYGAFLSHTAGDSETRVCSTIT